MGNLINAFMFGSASKLSYVPEILVDSPDGFWMLHETSGTIALDGSGNGWNGTYQTGFTLDQVGPGGSITKAAALTGETLGTGLIEFPNSAASLTGDFTIGMLVKFDAAISSGYWNFLSLISGTEYSAPIQISAGSSGSSHNFITVRVGYGSAEVNVLTPPNDLGTTWHHVAFRCSGNTYSMLIDGVEIGSSTSSHIRTNSGQPLRLGRRTATSGQRGRSGKYAGLYVVNSALSDERIKEHYLASLRVSGYPVVVASDYPSAYWPLGTSISNPDWSGNGRTLTWGSSPTALQILPSYTGGINLAGSHESSVDYNATTWKDDVRTIEAWVKFTSTSDMAILSRRNTSEHFALYHDNTNGLRVLTARNSGYDSEAQNTGVHINDGELHHVVMRWNHPSDTGWAVYVDGVSVASGSLVVGFSQSPSNDIIRVGSETGGRKWNGQIGHVAVYSTPLTGARIAAHYAAGSM